MGPSGADAQATPLPNRPPGGVTRAVTGKDMSDGNNLPPVFETYHNFVRSLPV